MCNDRLNLSDLVYIRDSLNFTIPCYEKLKDKATVSDLKILKSKIDTLILALYSTKNN